MGLTVPLDLGCSKTANIVTPDVREMTKLEKFLQRMIGRGRKRETLWKTNILNPKVVEAWFK